MTRATLSTLASLAVMAIAGNAAPARAQQSTANGQASLAVATPAPPVARHSRTARHAMHSVAQAPAGMPRTLSDVHIEGEIPVPQVLFITARDQRRFMDFQHHRYLKTSLQLGADTPFPTWVAVVNGSPVIPKKEH